MPHMTPMKPPVCLAVVLAVLFAARTPGQETPTERSYLYKKTAQAALNLKGYFPAGWKAEDKRPAIVFFFGGGWTSGTPTQFEPQARHLAGRGMVAFCADYRVKSRHAVTPDVCVEDAKSAIRWVRSNADMLGIDPDRIVGSGGSAGGHLAACTGFCPGLDAKGDDPRVSSRPNVLILYNPVLNLSVPELIQRVGNDEQLAKAISPTQHLTKESPPTLLFFGKEDRLLAQGEEFVKRSKELEHRTEIFLADGVAHGFFNRVPWLDKTTQRADEFLVSLGYLQAK